MNLNTDVPELIESNCPACHHTESIEFFSSTGPLATIAWPKTQQEAKDMKQLPLNFVRCLECGHIYNKDFSYSEVPYDEKPNLMFNSGKNWAKVISNEVKKLTTLLANKNNITVVEIGHGEGGFLSSLGEALKAAGKNAKLIGFDPHGAEGKYGNVEFKRELFKPENHITELKPDLVLMRHVLEHFKDPLSFLKSIVTQARLTKHSFDCYFEVPCVDNILRSNRTVDLYYEHISQFTTDSFGKMLTSAGFSKKAVNHIYGGEVIMGIVEAAANDNFDRILDETLNYRRITVAGKDLVAEQLLELKNSGKRIAVWGGTGKSAAFINHYGLDAKRFPLVVDSDIRKKGTFVPGTGQEIVFRDELKENPAQIIIVPPQWRAQDILSEIEREEIAYEQILIEDQGKLIDFNTEKHIYKKPSEKISNINGLEILNSILAKQNILKSK